MVAFRFTSTNNAMQFRAGKCPCSGLRPHCSSGYGTHRARQQASRWSARVQQPSLGGINPPQRLHGCCHSGWRRQAKDRGCDTVIGYVSADCVRACTPEKIPDSDPPGSLALGRSFLNGYPRAVPLSWLCWSLFRLLLTAAIAQLLMRQLLQCLT